MIQKKNLELLSTLSWLTIIVSIIAAAFVLPNKEESVALLAAFIVLILPLPLIRQIHKKVLLKAAWQYYLLYFVWGTIAIFVVMLLAPFAETLRLEIRLLITLVGGITVTMAVIIGNRIIHFFDL